MKPTNQTAEKGFAIGIAGIILTLILIVLTHKAHPQSIGVGLGKVSDGRTSAKMYFVTPSGWGAYVNHYADAQQYIENSSSTGLQYIENPLTCMGITARIHNQVTLYAGAGSWFICKAYNDDKGYRYYEKSKGKCIEAGAVMTLISAGLFRLELDASLNSTLMVNSMILLTVNLEKPCE